VRISGDEDLACRRDRKAACEHTHNEFGQTDERIEAENVLPEERDFAGIDFVGAVGMKKDVSERRHRLTSQKPTGRETAYVWKFLAAKQKKRKQKIEEASTLRLQQTEFQVSAAFEPRLRRASVSTHARTRLLSAPRQKIGRSR